VGLACEHGISKTASALGLKYDSLTMKILGLSQGCRESAEAESGQKADRTGVFTSGIVSIFDDYRISLFFTGPDHAGENLVALLKQRSCELGPPIQMCDALSRNMPAELDTILANCLAHGRRQFVDVAMNFPQECLYVLEVLKEVYTNDGEARRQGMSGEQRLKWHQQESGPRMDALKAWLTDQIEQHKVEPNSGLGEAITYMLKHWEALTLFLRGPAAPLDNNTCELNKVNAFEYLTVLQKHTHQLASHPDAWMPWNYRGTLQKVATR